MGKEKDEPENEILAEIKLDLPEERPDFLKSSMEEIEKWVNGLPEGVNKERILDAIKSEREKTQKNKNDL